MRKNIHGFKKILAWTHLLGMNVDSTVIAITMILAGLIGSGILSVITSGGSASSAAKLTPKNGIMVQFIQPIATFAAILAIGVIAGGIAFIATYNQQLRID